MLLHTQSESILEKIRAVFKLEDTENQSLLIQEQWAIVAERREDFFRGEETYHSLEEAKKIILRK